MTETKQQPASEMVVQEHCIDLPGESVQCWIGGGTDKLKVILRKHRDIIFDLKLGNGKSYTVESTESDFYNTRDKKIVTAARKGKVTFNDGERMHLWVSRGFRGALVVKCDGHIVAKVAPNELDKHRHGNDPKEKPAPIIMVIGKDTPPSPLAQAAPVKIMAQLTQSKNPSLSQQAPHITPWPAAAPTHEETCPVVCIVDGKVEGMPPHIAEHFKKGGDGSGFSDIDPNHVLTRNWIWGQATGSIAYAKDNWEWLKATIDGKTSTGFRVVRAQIHYVRGKVRFYFSGYSNSNAVYGRGGFGPGHERIMAIFSGMGKTDSAFMATLKGVGASFKGAALVNFIFGSATAIAEWKDDVKKDGYDLAAALIMATLKAILAAALVVLVVAVIVWLVMMVAGLAVPVLAVGAITVGVSILANYGIEAVDKFIGRKATGEEKNTDGIAAAIAPWMRKAGTEISDSWNYLMSKMPNDYLEISFEGP